MPLSGLWVVGGGEKGGDGKRRKGERAREKRKRIKGEKKWKREGRGQTDPLVLTILAPHLWLLFSKLQQK